MKTEIKEIKLTDLVISPTNPRKLTAADQPKLKEMAASIKDKGILQPLLIRKKPGTIQAEMTWEIICGERRFTAAKMAGLSTAPCIIQKLDDKAVAETQIIENMQRSDLTPMEEAEGYKKLHELHKQDWPEISARTGKSQDYIYTRLQLLRLIPEFQDQLRQGEIPLSHAEAITRLENPKDQETLYKDWEKNAWKYEELDSLKEAILDDFLLQLRNAPFSIKSADLPGGACTACSKRTGAQAALFPELIDKADTCRDPKCWKRKKIVSEDKIRMAFRKEMDAGIEVIVGEKAAHILDRGAGFVKPGDTSYKLKENLTWAKAIEKTEYKPAIVVDSKGNPHKMIKESDALKHIPASKKNSSYNQREPTPADKTAQEKKKRLDDIKGVAQDNAAELVIKDMTKLCEASDLTGLAKILLTIAISNIRLGLNREILKMFGYTHKTSEKKIDKQASFGIVKLIIVALIEDMFGYDGDLTDGFKALLKFYKLEKAFVRYYAEQLKAGMDAAAAEDAKNKPAPKKGVCRVCGCTENNACLDTKKGTSCKWTDDSHTLCTACVDKDKKDKKTGKGKKTKKGGKK